MKRSDFTFICIILLSGFILYAGICRLMGYSILANRKSEVVYNKPIITGAEGEDIPSINLFLVDSLTRLNVRSLITRKPVVLFYFSPYCPFCQDEVLEIIKGIDELKDMDFYFITPFPFYDMKQFYQKYELSKYRNIHVGLDYNLKFGEYFKTTSIPFIAVYDVNKKLKSAFLGNISYQQLKDVAEK